MVLKTIFRACILFALFSVSAEARPQQPRIVADGCNVLWPCEGVTASPRGERVARAMGGFGTAVKHYDSGVVAHPAGCPRVAFCACGASVYLLGSARAAPWLARAWYSFPRTAPAPRMAGVRAHHVVALIEHRQGSVWLVYDANSGWHATRIHEVDISRYTIVNPHS